MRILVVDDEEVLASTIAAILQGQGYDTAAAFSGTAAVELIHNFRPDLLVTDVAMPGMDGVETARAVVEEVPECKVLFISGQPMRFEEITARTALEFDFMAKPIQPVEMLTRIGRILSGSDGRRRKSILDVDD